MLLFVTRIGHLRIAAGLVLAAAVLGAVVVSTRAGTDEPEDRSSPSTTPSAMGAGTSPARVPEADAAWLPLPWALESTTRSAPVGAARPEYLFCGWRVPPSRVISGQRTAVSEQVLTHPTGLRARMIKYETDAPGGVANLFKHAYASCVGPGGAQSVAGPRNLWVYRGVVGGAEPGPRRGRAPASLDAQALHVVEISSDSAGRSPTRADVEAALEAWVSQT